jgi:hypothetical protein
VSIRFETQCWCVLSVRTWLSTDVLGIPALSACHVSMLPNDRFRWLAQHTVPGPEECKLQATLLLLEMHTVPGPEECKLQATQLLLEMHTVPGPEECKLQATQLLLEMRTGGAGQWAQVMTLLGNGRGCKTWWGYTGHKEAISLWPLVWWQRNESIGGFRHMHNETFHNLYHRARGGVVIEALFCKPESLGFEIR